MLYFNFWRYIRTLLRFTKEEAKVRKQALPFVHAISKFLKRIRARIHPDGLSKLSFEFFMETALFEP